MIGRKEVQEIASSYKKFTIGVLGSHSAEEVGVSAKSFGFKTVVVCEKGREKLYAVHNKHLFDHVMVLDKFKDIIKPEIQKKLVGLGTIFIPNRSFSVYTGYDAVENDFKIPLYGNRFILRVEERRGENNQYELLEKAGVRIPKQFSSPGEIDRLTIVKVQQKGNPLERAFFYPASQKDFGEQADNLVLRGIISGEDLESARIEEFVLGPRFNANFMAFKLFPGFDFVGFEDRVQVNIGGVLNLPAKEQLKLDVPVMNEEVGHRGVTMRESKKPLVYDAAARFLKVAREVFPPGMIGLFSLQGALSYDKDRRVEFVVFDLSPRIPGCPCVGPTSPEMRRLSLKYGVAICSPLDLCMMEIRKAIEEKRVSEVVT